MIRIAEVTNRSEEDAFILVPGQLAKDDPNWIEPLLIERREFLDKKHNAFFEHAEVAHWVAYEGETPLGRISAVVDALAPEVDGLRQGFFGMIDGRSPEVIAALFATAEGWLKDKGVGVVRGPFSLSINQTCGLLVEGFTTPPYLLMDHHPESLGPAVEAQGYAKVMDMMSYVVDVQKMQPERERRIATRPWEGLEVRSLDKKRYAQDLATITAIFNDAWSENWGFIPLTEAETKAMARDLKPILDPNLVLIAELDGEPIGFIVLLPNINEAIRDLGGKILPFGWAKLLWRLKVKGVKTARVPLLGVRKDISTQMVGKTLPARLVYTLIERARARGFGPVEMSWLLEDNLPMRHLAEAVGGEHTKTYRIYEKRFG